MRLQFLIDGKPEYPLGNYVHMSTIVGFHYGCAYEKARQRLLATQDSIDGTVPEEAVGEDSRKGRESHRLFQTSLGLVKGKTCEVDIIQEYGGLLFRGFLDRFIPPNTFEEWRSKKNPTISNHSLFRTDAYAYLFLQLHPELTSVQYYYKVWASTNHDYRYPDATHSKLFTSADYSHTEKKLDKIVQYYTGQIPCEPSPQNFDTNCKWYYNCRRKGVI